ncbi:unnamed protein product [Clonostachys rosea]|uniref:Bacteriophage T5 Orf172 DNA-binding domain-containing protein n=1 Tax=Bionectria ochroleuca TaxID=29856 RepID=A0ABY6UL13_BIOOC|nr:unnamed protein product [Clonostachys rosea]
MAFSPGVSFFVTFLELDPRKQRQCIFYTLKGKRCSWDCQQVDNDRARELYDQINRTPYTELSNLELLEDYARYNCCGPKPKGARHQNRIEDIDLLTPLAQRWLEEIQERRLADKVIAKDSTPATQDAQVTTASGPTIAPFVSFLTTKDPPELSSIIEAQKSISTAAEFVAGLPTNVQSSDDSPKYSEHKSSLEETEPRYDLRRRNDFEDKDKSIASSSPRTPRTRAPLSTFRSHVEEPDENVMSKILSPLVKEDFKKGSLYIFTRVSSPGYVKIGWTSRKVESRLESWSRCGYEPNLVCSVQDIPYAQRAETLIHYELVAEWRAERRCRGCGKSHREWFEINKERATRVVTDWAFFMISATIYDASGEIKTNWRDAIKKMGKMNEPITATKLLTHYSASIVARNEFGALFEKDSVPEAEVAQREAPASLERDLDAFETASLEQSLPILNDRFQDGVDLELPLSSRVEPQISEVLPPSPPGRLRTPEPHLEPSSGNQAERKFLGDEDQSELSQSSSEFQFGTGFNFSFTTPPATKPPSNLLTPTPTPSPQRTAEGSFGSSSKSRDGSLLLEQQGQKAFGQTMGKPQSQNKLDFALNNPAEQHPTLRTDDRAVFSFQPPIEDRTLSGAETKFDFSPKTPPEKPWNLSKDQDSNQNFNFSFRPPSQQQQIHITPDERKDSNSRSLIEDQQDLGSDGKSRFSFNRPSIKQPPLTNVGKFEFSFKSPVTQPLLTADTTSDLSPETELDEQTSLSTNQNPDLASKFVFGKQFTLRTRPFLPNTPPRSADFQPLEEPSKSELSRVPRTFPLAGQLITPTKFPAIEGVSKEKPIGQSASSRSVPEMIPLPPVTYLEYILLNHEP